jgi:Fe2+ transport system protein FeoA
VRSVDDADPELLKHLSEIGLVLNTRVQVVDYSPFDGNLQLLIDEKETPVILGPAITRKICVEILPGP